MRIKLAMIAAVLTAAGVPATAQGTGGLGAPLTERDAGRVVRVAPGSKVTIRLPSNAGTGYSWQLMRATNATLLAPIEATADPATPPGIVGGPESSAVRIRFPRRGAAEVVLGFVPPGRGRAPDKVLRYRFRVR